MPLRLAGALTPLIGSGPGCASLSVVDGVVLVGVDLVLVVLGGTTVVVVGVLGVLSVRLRRAGLALVGVADLLAPGLLGVLGLVLVGRFVGRGRRRRALLGVVGLLGWPG